MAEPVMKADADEIVRRRLELLTQMGRYSSDMQMPLHLTGIHQSAPHELGQLQKIWRELLYLRDALGTVYELYQCPDCEHYEGEHHASGCHRETLGAIARPRNWTPPPTVAPITVPVAIEDFEYDLCKAVPGCIYAALPGTKACAQHQKK